VANVLTGLIPIIYAARDIVSRELIGFIPNVQRDASAEGAALNQTVRVPIVPAAALEDITPGALPADSGDETIGFIDMSITKEKAYPIRWTGNEQLSVNGQLNEILVNQFAQGFRAICNAVEVDLALAAANGASRATGTAGTTPFGTAADLSDLAKLNQILDDNGAPATGRVCILNSASRANLEGKHSELFKVNEAADGGAMLRQRQMRQLQGFTMGYSAGFALHTKGTGASYVTNGVQAAGVTALAVQTGTGTILPGDVLAVQGDASQYVVGAALAAGSVGINNPGLRAQAASGQTVTVGNNYMPNVAFTPNALVLLARSPAMPAGGDDADDVLYVTDPISGLTFQVAYYRQYRRTKIEIGLAWGVRNVKSEHTALLQG
jgi:hypothetical protein